MVRRPVRRQPEIRDARLSYEEMKIAIRMIDRRIDDLENFDTASVQERSDPRIRRSVSP